MPKPIKVNLNNYLPQTCGVAEIGYFRYFDDVEANPNAEDIQHLKDKSGCGWVICSFTPNKLFYEDAYNQLVERYGKPVYQSPVRVNSRTKHKFFFCIFDTKGK